MREIKPHEKSRNKNFNELFRNTILSMVVAFGISGAPTVAESQGLAEDRLLEVLPNFRNSLAKGSFDYKTMLAPGLTREKYCEFYNGWLINESQNLGKLWEYVGDNFKRLTPEARKSFDEIFSLVATTKKNFSSKGLLTAERLVSGFLPSDSKEVQKQAESFFKKPKTAVECRTEFKKTFDVLGRNDLVPQIQMAMKSFVIGLTHLIEERLKNGEPEEKKKAKEMAFVFAKTMNTFLGYK